MVRTALIASVAAWLLLGGTAEAKQQAEALVVCGAERCREFGGDAVNTASTITMHGGRAPRVAAPFYDVFFVFREPGGRRFTPGGALRYVPDARAVRSHYASGKAIWFRADRALALTLRRAVDGLAPRPPRALNGPAWQVSRATSDRQETLGVGSPAPVGPGVSRGSDPAFDLRLVAALCSLTLVMIAGLAQRRRRRRRRRRPRFAQRSS